MSKLTIAAVAPELLDLVWDRVIPLVELVINKAPDDLNLDGIKKRIATGQDLLVVIYEGSDIIAFNTLKAEEYDTGKRAMFIPLTGGTRLDEWMADFLVIAEAIAKDYGCSVLRGIACRKGWLKVLNKDKDDNDKWNEVHTIIEYKIKGDT